MKLIAYTLNSDGTIPDYVVNGGYFPNATSGDPPQDWTLVGWASDDAGQDEIGDLTAYLISIGADSWTDELGNPVDLNHMVKSFLSVT